MCYKESKTGSSREQVRKWRREGIASAWMERKGLSQEVTLELMAWMTKHIQLWEDVRHECARQRETQVQRP